jgi:Heterokaryon incompatibility protein (HET)
MDEYIYRPLARDRDEIRLLRLFPAPSGGEVEIEIFHADTASNPSYEALSYVWGSSKYTHEVCIRPTFYGDTLERRFANLSTRERRKPRLQTLGVSRNLSVALSYLTLPDRPRIFWIDAICIDQNNREEKSREVGRMGYIYSRARRVVVWLGEGQPDTPFAIATLKSISKSIELVDEYDYAVLPGSVALTLEKEISNPRGARANILVWMAIRSFFSAPWFTRLWVFQEIGLANDAVFVAGKEHIQWSTLRQAFGWVQQHSTISLSREITIRILDRKTLDMASPIFHFAYKIRQPQAPPKLLEILNWTKLLSCYDPRDRIYAILSLLGPYEAEKIVPDYTRPAEEIYKEAILNTIQYTRRIDILQFCDLAKHDSKLTLPSWVPDLSIPSTITFNDFWHATGFSLDESCYDEAREALVLKGRQVCVISEVKTPIPLSAGIEEILAICHAWEPAHAWSTRYVAGGLLIDAFVNTLFLASVFFPQLLVDLQDGLTPEALKAVYVSLVKEGRFSAKDDMYVRDFERYLPGRTMFTTREGYIGLCSASARPGDRIFVALGCPSPLLIRSVPGKNGYYQVGGGVFVYDLMTGEGILGPLPRGWSCGWTKTAARDFVVRVFSDGWTPTQLDPRLGPMPRGWIVTFDVSKGSERSRNEIDRNGMLRLWRFENPETGEAVTHDLRFTSKNLRRLGIELEDIVIV